MGIPGTSRIPSRLGTRTRSSAAVAYSSVDLSNGPKLPISIEVPQAHAGLLPIAHVARALGKGLNLTGSRHRKRPNSY
jgi:metal-dependent HD superfamily phosphatase/phosphodiesterase